MPLFQSTTAATAADRVPRVPNVSADPSDTAASTDPSAGIETAGGSQPAYDVHAVRRRRRPDSLVAVPARTRSRLPQRRKRRPWTHTALWLAVLLLTVVAGCRGVSASRAAGSSNSGSDELLDLDDLELDQLDGIGRRSDEDNNDGNGDLMLNDGGIGGDSAGGGGGGVVGLPSGAGGLGVGVAIKLEQRIAAVFNKVAYGSTTTKRSIPDNVFVPSLTTVATPPLTTYR